MSWWGRAVVTGGLALAAGCFTGGFLSGRACVQDDECGPSLRCEDGFCGGPPATAETTSSTGGSTTTGSPTSTTGSPTTGPASGTGTGALSSEGGESSTTSALTGTSADPTTGDVCAAATCEKIDLLLIIDNSPSMDQWQEPLLQALLTLGGGKVGDLVRDSCDAHIGVLTTEAPYPYNPRGCQDYGSLVRFGGQTECNDGRPYATQEDDLGAALGCQALVGTDGSSDERPIQALLTAMTPPFNDPGGCNDGFFRADSLLVVVLITDEDDDADADDEPPDQQTPGTPADWFAQVVAFKGSAERVVMVGLMGDLGGDPNCPWIPGGSDGTGAESPDRIRAFFDMFPRRAVGSLCHDKYPDFIKGPVYTAVAGACEVVAAP